MAHPRHILCDTPQRLIIICAVLAALCTTVYASAVATAHYSSTSAYSRFGDNHLSLTSLSADSLRINDTSTDHVRRTLEEPAATALSLNRPKRHDERTNVCDGICECSRRTHFLVVECDLKRNMEYIFGTKNYIPRDATSLTVKLAPKASLRFETDLFKHTKVNGIKIEGSTEGNQVHVEFRSNSTTESLAPNPEITIRNCHTLVLHESAIGGDIKLKIENCNEVIILSNALHSTSFFAVIDGVKDLRIYEKAFSRATGNLRIHNSYIESLYRFDAFFREIAFYNCTIGTITDKTFDVLEINAIIFFNCRIKIINTKAITEKLHSGVLNITGGSIGMIETEAIFGSGITELVLSNNQIDKIESNAIHVSAINASIVHNRILRVNHEWLRVSEWTKVIVSNNTFGEYNLMVLDKRDEKSTECKFEKNRITLAMPGSLIFPNRNCVIREIVFSHLCKCLKYDNWLKELSPRDIRSESYCTIQENLKFCFNRTSLNVLKYENEICSDSSDTLDCVKQNNLKNVDGEFIKPEELETNKENYLYLIIAAGVLLMICIIVLVIVFASCARKRKSVMNRDCDGNTIQSLTNYGRLSKEDRRIIKETMKVYKRKYSGESYKELNKHVQNMLRENIDETELVQTIGEILPILNRCENSGDTFLPFNEILERLLQPAEGNDPVYAEPQLQDRVFYNQIAEGQTDVEHIYNEPIGVQQPLLTNDYATPADRNEEIAVYTEPINDKINNTIAPYAAVTAKHLAMNNVHNHLVPQQPSTSRNLPDVLKSSSGRTKPMSNVQKLVDNFSNNPNFHINRSPTTNRRIPQYTISTKVGPGPSQHTAGKSNPTSLETSSNHSGSSDITVKIDDIEYADA